ncbi:MAG: hypothetical protein CSA96_07230 [Bacteroidetes bacterium]|nr:MAG: hypothetical protein CSA96_07230 [Bacteroidota bacterium]
MFSRNYRINPENLRIEKVRMGRDQRLRFTAGCVLGLVFLAIGLRIAYERVYETPRELAYMRENTELREAYSALNTELEQYEDELIRLRDRDDRFYRSILSLDPISPSIRKAGTGGSVPYSSIASVRDAGELIAVSSHMTQLSGQLEVQSKSLESVYKEALLTHEFLACKPSINPISTADTYWLTSPYGYRTDPFTKRRTAHHGIDLAGARGLKVHATGNGRVSFAKNTGSGYGLKVVVDHGFGYSTVYAHLGTILVKPGQVVKRGEVIATLGNSGRSTGPHLHYEVRFHNQTKDPMYFFSNDFGPEEYTLLAKIANSPEG